MKLKVRNSTNGSRIKISNLMTLKPDQMLLVAKANRKTQILSSFLKRICEYCKLSYGEELQFTDRCKYCDWNIHGTRYEVSATQNLDIQLSPESAEHVQSVRSRLSKSLHSSQYITPYLIPRFPHFHHQFHSDITHCTFGLKKISLQDHSRRKLYLKMQFSNIARLLAATACFFSITTAVPMAPAEGMTVSSS